MPPYVDKWLTTDLGEVAEAVEAWMHETGAFHTPNTSIQEIMLGVWQNYMYPAQTLEPRGAWWRPGGGFAVDADDVSSIVAVPQGRGRP